MRLSHLLAATLLLTASSTAFAAQADGTARIRAHGRTMSVPVMKMDDGGTVYALSRRQLEQIMQQNMASFYTSNVPRVAH